MAEFIHQSELINWEAEIFIKELGDRKFTVQDYRSIIHGNASNYIKSKAKEYILLEFNRHPSVQLNGVGMNGNIMKQFLKEMEEEKILWYNNVIREVQKNKDIWEDKNKEDENS